MLIRDQWDAPKPPVDRWHLRHFGMNPLTQDIGTGNLKYRWLMRGWAARPRPEDAHREIGVPGDPNAD